MPELPEVEVLARHLNRLLTGKIIRAVEVRRKKVLHPTPLAKFTKELIGTKFLHLHRRGKYLVFELKRQNSPENIFLLGHLGMTGRMFLAHKKTPEPKHTAVVLGLARYNFIYEDPRYFGRLTLDLAPLAKLGPEPLSANFPSPEFTRRLQRSTQPIKVKLLDQSLVAGIGNIYASEALFHARISPRLAANKLTGAQINKLGHAIRKILTAAIKGGSTIPLNFAGDKKTDNLFYFGRATGTPDYYEERLRVYDRAGQPCANCGSSIHRIVQAARSTFFCPQCQKN